ncbi:MAG: hypothetical protein EOM05_00785 [Clostridia bacterium]|nr:hypothetical protein [Clostridia bacterium]
MFTFASGVSTGLVWLVLLAALVSLFGLNELTRRFKWIGFFAFVVLPTVLTILWLTVLRETAYMDWFHLLKVYSSTAGCIGFWCIRHLKGTNKKTGKEWKLSDKAWALCFPPLILAVNIAEAVIRDFQVGMNYSDGVVECLNNQVQFYIGGSWNYMNAIAGILNVITITGWFGICIRKKTKKDGSQDMLWPDMLWFWIIAYDLWNFAYTYNCLPGHAWYCGIALLLAPTLCAFTIGKGAWLQHRAQTLALWCMFAQTFPAFLDEGRFAVDSSSASQLKTLAAEQGIKLVDGNVSAIAGGASVDTNALFIFSLLALIFNIGVFGYMIYKVVKTKRNPYTSELYTDLAKYQEVKALAE